MRSTPTFDAISAHAQSLDQGLIAETQSELYADICAARQIEIREHELRAFVVRHSVFRIHGILVLAVVLLVVVVLRRSSGFGNTESIAYFVTVASLVIATSTYSIAAALQPRH